MLLKAIDAAFPAEHPTIELHTRKAASCNLVLQRI
jgi:hypothetical protein